MSITHQLRLFVDVVQQGSFAKAATLNNMDNSSLSKQIKKLEETLGVQLLNRSTRSFFLTSAGEDILAETHVLLESLDNIKGIADSYHSEPKGIIRIVSAVFLGQQYVQPVISCFMRKYPNVQVTLHLDDRKTDIIADHFDLAIRMGKLTDSNLIAKKLAKTNFAIVASKEFLEQHGTPQTPEELITLPAVIYNNGDVCLDSFKMSRTPGCKEMTSYKMQGNYKVNDVRTMMSATQNGTGYCVIDLFNLEKPIDELGLVPLLTDYTLSTQDTGIYAIYPHRKQTLLVSEFINQLKSYIGEPARWEAHIPDYQNMYKQ
ncbi:LysR family transcriptional regulator [Vibrio barjaei]|uniref:LysR family transcriptional regulator n=1 Tax=Vibrio barjaei TaxID=1676683 RepID=UPI002284E524|nr:LysR family transcriptional regulator [Vibrio barjaei]MCY9873384.1 LysR family transcriptional regulator [Vibrio barjaei]